jgi:hypothetical protein
MERLEYDLLFRWFVRIGLDNAAWDHGFLEEPQPAAGRRHRPSCAGAAQGDEAFVERPLLGRWHEKSDKPKDGSDEPSAQGGGRNAEVNFHG